MQDVPSGKLRMPHHSLDGRRCAFPSCADRVARNSASTREVCDAETAADLVDNIPSTSSGQALPQVPVRQWVLSFPIPLRSLFAIRTPL